MPQTPDDGKHDCPRDGCGRRLPVHLLACGAHWRLVSRPTQRRVYAAWDAGDAAEHVHARAAAVAEMNGRPVCRVCGCTDETACVDQQQRPCSWVAPDLCSACRT